MNQRRAALYLQIPAAYCLPFGGLRWAQYGEAVEFLDGPDAGRTFAFAAEIAQFLEGLLSQGEAFPAFGSVLHLLIMLGLGDRAATTDRLACFRKERLVRPFRDLERPLRNAGALCASLLVEQPGPPLDVADPPEPSQVLELLNGGSWIPQMVLTHPMLGAMDYAEQPARSVLEFDAMISARIDTRSDEAIRHWLQFGRGPVGRLDDAAIPLPQGGLAEAMARVEERPRLSGLARLVSRLEGALSLPPRRLEHDGPQADGYWDLTTRGAPEQILPIQFALEDDEFLRRFAARELLYFHRERPSRPVVQELVLILDQGVRTWGDVRLVLAGATMALARQAARRELAVRLATTGDEGEPVDPTGLSPDRLGHLLEASDLSRNPSLALDRILRVGPASLRDVVLLTHPRSLAEPEVVAAALRPEAGGATRLFAVTVDAGGEVELAELKHGSPVVSSRCRVDLSESTAPPTPTPKSRTPGHPAAWKGDVDAIPFPFRCGIPGPFGRTNDPWSRLVDFDAGGGRLFMALRQCALYACALDEGDAEILPGPLLDNKILEPVRGVIGVAGGLVVVADRDELPVLAHYDFPTRDCTIHGLPALARRTSPVSWSYYTDLHSLGGRPAETGRPFLAIDLSARGEEAGKTPRARTAAQRARAGVLPYPLPGERLETTPSDPWANLSCHSVALDATTGTLSYLRGIEPRSLTPTADGRPALRGRSITAFQQGGDVLAVQVESRSALEIWFLSIARTAVIGSFSYDRDGPARGWFALTRDGRRFARRVGQDRIEIRDVPGDRPPSMILARERTWHHFASLGRSCLLVREFEHVGARRPHAEVLIRWDSGDLEVDHDDPIQAFARLEGVVPDSRGKPYGMIPRGCDGSRFTEAIERKPLRVLVDRYNHLAVLGRGDRLVAVFYTSGREFAAWMPDGTTLGSARLIGGGPSRGDAASRIAAALRAAERGEEGPT